MALEHLRTWMVGDVRITRIVEVWNWEDHINMALAGAQPEIVQAHPWLLPHYATPEGRMFINFQAFVVQTPNRTIMVDTCIGAERERDFPVFSHLQTTFLEDLLSLGIRPEDVDTVLCTHLHFDHVGWNTRRVDGEWVPTFPNARYLLGRAEFAHWQHLRATDHQHSFHHLVDSVDPIVAAGLVDFIDHHHAICPEISLLPTPGHTPDHVSVLIHSGESRAVITGDMMHHPIQISLPAHPATFDMDKERGAETRVAFVEQFKDRPVLVIGTHFPEPGAGYIVDDETCCRLQHPR